MANTFFYNTGKVFMKHNMPVILDCNFVVDVANGNGLGLRNLKGPGIQNAFMHTSASPGIGNNGVLNPNPASGYIAIQLSDNYNQYLYGASGFVSPASGANIAVTAAGALLTVGQVYIITVVGTTTAADWTALGLPTGVTPVAGAAFVAKATGAGVGSGQVQVPKANGSGITTIEVVGDPQKEIAPSSLAIQGSWIFVQCLAATAGGNTALVATAPADGSVVGLQFVLSNSSVVVAGES